jgi:hypothetical protein
MADGIAAGRENDRRTGFSRGRRRQYATDVELERYAQLFIRERLRLSEFHPDAVAGGDRDPAQAHQRLAAVAGSKYSYRELDDFTERIARTLRGLPSCRR